jgi:hypothetical protein
MCYDAYACADQSNLAVKRRLVERLYHFSALTYHEFEARIGDAEISLARDR